jgi:hypothetical protein
MIQLKFQAYVTLSFEKKIYQIFPIKSINAYKVAQNKL